MFISKNKVRMHDTDMAGILYFARQFRYAHDAFEDFLESEGYSIDSFLHKHGVILAIVHAEADYLLQLRVGDGLEVHLSIEKLGDTSVTFLYEIYRNKTELVGKAKTVHVCLNHVTRKKMALPDWMRKCFEKHLSEA